ncbi:hypothetical protein PV08_02829 [Exophiala spinifera]|uniref:Xylanolytic transcriptional activator regulatory domain-containing protein n=1 Tax=Exophiala spinifera TaxID=91928 RepID=A0A0D1YTK0_9EURO|nr:uncharacterized protein PV08_02829 [Exophiala spinifera]KIW18541.1 hypothetical protein PV08_02829 [Exophiala spinifera]
MTPSLMVGRKCVSLYGIEIAVKLSATTNQPDSYLNQLEERIARIEGRLSHCQPQSHPGPRLEASRTSQNGSGDDIPASTASSVLGHQAEVMHGATREIESSEDVIDGMGAMKFTDEEDSGYYGPSSNIAFIQSINLAITRADHLSPRSSVSFSRVRINTGLSVSRRRYVQDKVAQNGAIVSQGSVSIYALPSEARTWSLIGQYFSKSGQLLPLIHEESFREAYFQMKQNNFTMARRTWLGLLNIMLALATMISNEGHQSAVERIKESDVYYQRAQGLCDRESSHTSSIELEVQYLLILGQYLQSTQKSVQAWTVHGLAITLALQLGLHSSRTNQEFSSLESEIRKRVWYGCVLLDRTLSMTFGRPAVIPDRYVCLDLPSQHIQILGRTPGSPIEQQADARFFIATIKLYKVMYHIIDTCYGQNLGLDDASRESDIVLHVLEGSRHLRNWREEAGTLKLRVWTDPLRPSELSQMKREETVTHRFNIVISLRYHNLRILLYRPILEAFLDAHGSSRMKDSSKMDVSHQVGVSSISSCVDSAMVIISVIHTIVTSEEWHPNLLGAWNYSAFYTFNAGLVLFATLLVSQSGDAQRWEFVERAPQYLTFAIEALRKLDPGNSVVERCVNYLSRLTALLDSGTGGIDHQQSGLFGPEHPLPRNTNPEYPCISYSGGARGGDLQSTIQHTSNQGLMTRAYDCGDLNLNEFMLDTDLDFFSRPFDSIS